MLYRIYIFITDPDLNQLAKQLIIQAAMEKDSEAECDELPGIFSDIISTYVYKKAYYPKVCLKIFLPHIF